VNPGGGTVTFRYDPFGRRIQKSGPLGTTNYLYDGANLLEEVDQSGNVLARYTQSGLLDEPLSELRGTSTSYYQDDGLDSITSLSNSASALANSYTYDSYGKLTASSGTVTNPFQYTAREFDSETGLNYNRARYYNPTYGRFISEDPLGFGGGSPNVYAYVGNNPINLLDPLGLTNCVVTPTMGTVCSDWNTNWSWMETKGPQPPSLPSDLAPNPPPPPCSCTNYFTAENDEIDRRSLAVIARMVGVSGLIYGIENVGPRAIEPCVPWAHWPFLAHDLYDLWEIQAEVSAKYKHCHQKVGM
jgi:RHS repeat-associated protein